MARKGYSGKPLGRASRYEPYAVLNSSTGSMLAGGTRGHTHFGLTPGCSALQGIKGLSSREPCPAKRKVAAGRRRPQLKFNPILFDSFSGTLSRLLDALRVAPASGSRTRTVRVFPPARPFRPTQSAISGNRSRQAHGHQSRAGLPMPVLR
jgi:hypothetical protein